MEVLDSLRQKKIKFFCPILDTSTYVPAFICDILDRRRRRYKLCTTDTGAQFDKDNTDLYSCGSRNSGGDTAEKAPAE